MSHFTITVCLPSEGLPDLARAAHTTPAVLKDAVETKLSRALAPFDENLETEPRRDYEEGGPEDYWWVTSVRQGAESWQELQDKGAEALAAERLSRHGTQLRNPGRATEMVAEHAKEWEKDSERAARLGEHPSWADVVALYNECCGSDDGEKLLIDDSGRAYRMTTYNPDSKWDWYQIGGRWPGASPTRRSTRGSSFTAHAAGPLKTMS